MSARLTVSTDEAVSASARRMLLPVTTTRCDRPRGRFLRGRLRLHQQLGQQNRADGAAAREQAAHGS
jgi:hypothetical protein